MELTSLIEALSDPAAYPYPVKGVEVRQTHISVVFLAGDFAYKVKKPVNPDFLDFSTLEKRRHFCEEEVRLNRRLAPEVYVCVVPVVQTPTGGAHFEGPGPAIEWGVKMQRLPEAATFRERLQRGEINAELLEALAGRIASFHRTAEASRHISTFGGFEAVARIVLDIFTQAAPQVGTTVSQMVFDSLRSLTKEHLDRLHPLIEERARNGVTRDVHGDLHLDHVYLFPDKTPPADLVIVDCIEFNQRFRYLDPVADMAFAVMDFAFLGRHDLAQVFADAYFRASGDEKGKPLLPLYTAYRATVRGLVDGLKAAEPEVPAAERATALIRARARWLLALGELEEPGRKPCLLLVAGLPGTGKSALAKGLAEQAGFRVIRSDVVRKELAGLAPRRDVSGQRREASELALPPCPLTSEFYTPQWTERTYQECAHRAEQLLFEGKRVLIDATFREETKRRSFLELAARCAVPAAMLVCRAESATVRRRLAGRQGDASDADWSVYLKIAAGWETPSPVTQRLVHEIPADGSRDEALSRAVQSLRKLGLQS
jgi:aminoglycoside phosphotransferase family enzyme/predicted kinase